MDGFKLFKLIEENEIRDAMAKILLNDCCSVKYSYKKLEAGAYDSLVFRKLNANGGIREYSMLLFLEDLKGLYCIEMNASVSKY